MDLTYHFKGAGIPPRAVAIGAFCRPLEDRGEGDSAKGTGRWRTLINGETCQSRGLTARPAELGPYANLNAHRHPHAQICFGIAVDGVVTIDGASHRPAAGVALCTPGNAEHRLLTGIDETTFIYTFAVDRVHQVDYCFSPQNRPRTSRPFALPIRAPAK